MTPRLLFLDLRGDSPRPMPTPPARSVLCLGNFDGVHLAHQALLREGIRLRQRLDAHRSIEGDEPATFCGVFCFFRPSIDYAPHAAASAPAHLTSLRDKLYLFAQAGMDFACLCDFPAVRDLSPTAFTALLQAVCHCRGVVCGFNYRFGRNAQGTPAALIDDFGCDRVTVMPEMQMDGMTVSSSRIRACLTEGDAETAARLLGRPYAIQASVVHGKQLGRTLGFPTANQFFLPECLIPAHGVYAALCHTPYGIFAGVANVGCHPTVDAHARVNCETYLIGLDRDLYGRRMRVEFLRHLRGERKFADVGELTEAIRRDAQASEAYVRAWLSAPARPR